MMIRRRASRVRRTDPCPRVGQVKEIRGLELAKRIEWDPCHLVWQVNKISLAVEKHAGLNAYRIAL